jgi:hypothetical protein
MASTYSPNLRLELIGTGEQQGSWGTTTNTNLGTLIEEAIGGYVAVTVTDGADTTLTTVNGSTDQSRNMTINLTGALTATRNVICPAIEKVYVVRNSTTGGFAVTFKVSGQTGVSIPNGATYLIYVDGTDARQASGGIASGGTGASTAPNALANLMTFTSTATAAGTTVLTAASTYIQLFTGSTTQTITLPVTSTLTQGWSYHISNNSTGNLTVNSSGGNLVITVLPGTTAMVTCILTSGTTAASWDAGITDFTTATGTGNVVLSNSPTLVTPTIGVANATSINKVAITAPATSATLTIANAKTLTVNNSLTLAGTDSTTMTFPAVGANVLTDNNTATILKGYTVTPNNLGTGAGTITPAASNHNYQYIINNAAFTLAAPAADSAIDLQIFNGSAAGTITMSGFKTAGTGATGATYATTANTWWVFSIRRLNSVATYTVTGPWT